METNTTKIIPLNAYYTGGISLNYTDITINDMKATDNGECWFCGMKSTESAGISPYLPTVSKCGFIGHFSINDVISGSGTYEICLIRGTENLTKIEPRGDYQQLFLVGYRENSAIDPYGNPISSCIVGYDPYGSHKYDIAYPLNLDEIISDVTTVGVGVVFSSYYLYDHYHIGLRHVKNGPIREDFNLETLGRSNKYDILTAIPISSSILPPWREYQDPVILSSSLSSNIISMAHSCSNNYYGVATYKLYMYGNGDARISKARLINTPSYCKLCDLKVSSDNITYYLTEDATLNQCILHETDWNSYTFGMKYTSRYCNRNDYIWQSIIDYDSVHTYLYISGHKPNGSPIYAAYRNVNSIIAPCIPRTNHNLIELDTPTFTSGSSMALDPIYNNYSADVYTGTFTSTTVTPFFLCHT